MSEIGLVTISNRCFLIDTVEFIHGYQSSQVGKPCGRQECLQVNKFRRKDIEFAIKVARNSAALLNIIQMKTKLEPALNRVDSQGRISALFVPVLRILAGSLRVCVSWNLHGRQDQG